MEQQPQQDCRSRVVYDKDIGKSDLATESCGGGVRTGLSPQAWTSTTCANVGLCERPDHLQLLNETSEHAAPRPDAWAEQEERRVDVSS